MYPDAIGNSIDYKEIKKYIDEQEKYYHKEGDTIKMKGDHIFPKLARKGDFIDIDGKRYIPTFNIMDNIVKFPFKEGIYLLVDEWIEEEQEVKMEPSIERAIFKRMTTEKGTYGYEDIVRMTAEEICKLKSIKLTHEFFQGFLEASKYYDERKREENEG